MVNKENYLTDKAVVKKHSTISKEKGVFAAKPIKKGELVAIFGGRIVHTDQIKDQINADEGDYLVQVSDDHFLALFGKKEKLDDAEFINHSCNPNCGIKGQIIVEAMRSIEPGEELTFDYAMTDTKLGGFECNCGSKNCRKVIRPDDWKIKELQQRYKGYFSYYIQKKILEQK